ncbi:MULTISPECIES: NifB/NifX family molybdenum-iron cluster-binding protein [Dehalobacter]|jgi:predicted Fe-Mo cluster-binding NifX family protein|uniref:Dinitrogenase iron-molybdenum cofactor biosynthesis protein n=2 Tax=Dehalobacter restrictus TaxID=55583 RepID=A0A857DFP3_9FIRM|nr:MULTISPECIES: NifB/NifX family molybdenum-iron cluster-binding protein [Dehalobacter]AHF08936.1 dinitrogenase iron-molybdenum cofactor biosynthesis protein [Dehalobacter restrictus DSM 9455]MCG1026053.1 NifB/NifX family molybdenum-iron cluster-binding protein [Dehalobacter sp.]MDJ0306671.1 NifB/NifX family molybdenum-iron cluster-binding protein [Dehalobacter sp.]OCZ50905.1 dinitrogenase iron-molybdenum cofactor biosynthesis protein [Dehalobacter sp. TeCB1]QGZ99457.1 dinitrogenase iron-moly
MKIAIPVDNNSMDSSVCISFGRAPYLLIYDTETEGSNFLDNSAAASQGGAGIKAAQNIVDSGAEAIITPRCGENAAEVLKAAEIKLYKNTNNSIRDNIESFKEGKLSLLDDIHPGFHQHGGK